METHVKVLGWLYIILSLMGILLAGFVIIILILGGAISGDRTAMAITSIVGISVGTFLLLLSFPGIVVGIGLLRLKQWARVLGLVLGILNLGAFPVGTALGVYALVVLFSPEAERIFVS